MPELASKDAVGSLDRCLIPRLAWCRKDGNDLLLEQEDHHLAQCSWPGTGSCKSKAIINLDHGRLLKTLKEATTVLDHFVGSLRLNTLKVLEFTGKSERKGNEGNRLRSPGDILLANKVDLQQTVPKLIDRVFRIVKVTTRSFASDLWLGR